MPLEITDLVYPETRYDYGQSPQQIYIPNKQIMFELMRAGIDVKESKDLWFRKENEKLTLITEEE